MDESESRRQRRDAEEARRRRIAELLRLEKLTPEPSPTEKLEQEAKLKREAAAAAAEARRDKSHVPAAAVFAFFIGTIGTGLISVMLHQAKAGCFGGIFSPPKTDAWCVTVNALQTNDATYWIIGLVLGAIAYGAVYLYYYFVDN
ncbi:hypothetical protein [Arthrobacter humicola]